MSRIIITLLISIALLSSIDARHRHKNRRHHRHECKHEEDTNKIFKKFYKDVIEVDRKEENFCKGQTAANVKEYYGSDSYKLIVPLQGAAEEELKIKIHHTAILLTVKNKFFIMRELPEIVNPKKSSYIIEEGRVEVLFPYDVIFGREIDVTCDNDINDKSHYVPKAEQEVDFTPLVYLTTST